MVVLTQPRRFASGGQTAWKTIQEAAPLKVQKYAASPAEAAVTSITAALTGDKKGSAPYRVVMATEPCVELATACTAEEAACDAELLLLYIVGVMPEDPGAISDAVRQVLAGVVVNAVHESGGDVPATLSDQGDAGLARQLEPWALRLLENADKFRYICYAMKIATSVGADLATAGLGGEEVVGLCFASVDAAILSSWLAWFTTQLLDDSLASNVVQQTLSFDFAGGPRAVMAQADAICASMRPEDVEQVTRLALLLKRRFAVLVGDVISLFIPNDMGAGGAVVTEMLTRLKPIDAMDALKKLIWWYELIKPEHRGLLEDRNQLTGAMQATNNSLRTLVLSEYDQPLQRKGINAFKRNVVSLLIPGGPPLNFAASLAIGANVGRSSCAEIFDTLDEKMSNASATVHKVLAVAIGTLVVLAHCADMAEPSSTGGQSF